MISFGMRGIKELESAMRQMPYGVKKVALPAFSEYMIGDDSHGLKHYPPWRGQKYVRTFTLKGGWRVVGGTYAQRIENPVEYTQYVPRWKKYGWREWADVIQSNMAGALRHAQAKVNEYLRNK